MTVSVDEGTCEVRLADGSVLNLETLDSQQLLRLQWEQEQQFARKILSAPKGDIRQEILRHAHDTVTTILAAAWGGSDGSLVMGMHPRYARMVRKLLGRQAARGASAALV